MAKKSKVAKIFIYVTLGFIIFASFAAYIVMYAGIANSNKNNCPEGYILNEETGECEKTTNGEEIDNANLDNEKSCTEQGGTWYEENGVCILSDAQ